ncbi:MAG: Serine/threonine-protein kinase PknB [Dehalococcoidia bacterium]|nr:Serine/threonine-protein kinase PknB [Bacillota bacterium]
MRNIGTAHAEALALSFPRRMDVEYLKDIPKLDRGEETRLTVRIKPVEKGKVPVTLSISFRDKEGNRHTGQQTVDFNVETRAKEREPDETKKPPTHFPAELAGSYTEVEPIGEGGFARIFKAKNKDGKKVAVKVPLSLDEATGESFIKEMQNWTGFDHLNIVKAHRYNIMPVPFFELELCDSSLDEMERPLEPEKAAWLIFNICEGLKYAHSQGVIHRDLKPGNILLKDGMPKISDWGLSKVMAKSPSKKGLASFTPEYAAPEQINMGEKDERTDIWQLGVILYQLVTGEIPFKGESMVEMGMAIITKEPVSPSSLNPEAESLEFIITRCLKKDQAERYLSVGELQRDLAQYLGIKYKESLKKKDFTRSADFCSELLMVNMKIGDMINAYKFASVMAQHYAEGEAKPLAEEFCGQLETRINAGYKEPPEELVRKAEVICHKIRVGFKG